MSQLNKPTVCAVMLVNGRPEMVKRAGKCFREQTYEHKRLVIFDTNPEKVSFELEELEGEAYVWAPNDKGTIGHLRNEANEQAVYIHKDYEGAPEAICHWDSDDWSHPRRIEEQVALLLASGKECVGYRDMLFWKTEYAIAHTEDGDEIGEPFEDEQLSQSWLYRNGDSKYCLGTSLCYWRSAWEARPFEDLPKCPTGASEDTQWLRGVNSWGVTSFGADISLPPEVVPVEHDGYWPRMIAAVHAGNTSSLSALGIKHGTAPEWQRASEWGDYCRERMAL